MKPLKYIARTIRRTRNKLWPRPKNKWWGHTNINYPVYDSAQTEVWNQVSTRVWTQAENQVQGPVFDRLRNFDPPDFHSESIIWGLAE